jgi:hypothetical protein
MNNTEQGTRAAWCAGQAGKVARRAKQKAEHLLPPGPATTELRRDLAPAPPPADAPSRLPAWGGARQVGIFNLHQQNLV